MSEGYKSSSKNAALVMFDIYLLIENVSTINSVKAFKSILNIAATYNTQVDHKIRQQNEPAHKASIKTSSSSRYRSRHMTGSACDKYMLTQMSNMKILQHGLAVQSMRNQ